MTGQLPAFCTCIVSLQVTIAGVEAWERGCNACTSKLLMLLSFVGSHWPLNFHFTFYFGVLVAFLTVGLSFGLPRTSEKKRERDS